jgi:S-DNA-T family DNA segregation ATPase FtsK/SpoIIIE
MPARRVKKSVPEAVVTPASTSASPLAVSRDATPQPPTAEPAKLAKDARADWFSLGLVFAWCLLACSLIRYVPTLPTYPEPLDPADARVEGGPSGLLDCWPMVTRWADALAEPLHRALGWSAWVGLAGGLAVVLARLRRWGGRAVARLAVGWLILTVGLATFACFAPTGLASTPLVGEGGVLGAWVWLTVCSRVPEPLAAGVIGAMLLAGLVLVWPGLGWGGVRLLHWLAGRVWRITGWLAAWAMRQAGGAVRTLRLARLAQRLGDPWPAPHTNPASPASASACAVSGSNRVDTGNRPTNSQARPANSPTADIPVTQPAKTISKPSQRRDADLPPLSLLEETTAADQAEPESVLRERAEQLQQSLADFGLQVRVVGIHTGPVVTLFEIALETGLRLSRVTGLAEDLAVCLRVPSVRIVAPLPGKNTVGVEVPNSRRQVVRLHELIAASGDFVQRARLPLFLGKDSQGRPLVQDLAEMPHLLIAGTTGTGKSVCLNTVILSLLLTRKPQQVRLILIDPKMLELSEYGKLPHLLHPVVNRDMRRAEAILGWAVEQMEQRYELLSRARVRNLHSFNELGYEERCRRLADATEEERHKLQQSMPYIVIIIDEMGDLMMMMKKEVEGHIIRLAQKSRAAGIHLILATQKPTVDVITGLIKSNLPARICFKVASRTDSRVVLDEMGAEKLLGKGDMLYLQPAAGTLLRAQGAYASDREIAAVVEYLECDEPNYDPELLALKVSAGSGEASARGGSRANRDTRDPLYEQAVELVIREGRGSTSLLQRGLGIGYGRAARMIEWMAEDGIVGAYAGSQAREVLLTYEQWCQRSQPDQIDQD